MKFPSASGVASALLLAAVAPGGAQAPPAAEQHDMRLVGQHDLQARSAYQPVIHRQGGRWIAYVGHHGGRKPNPLTGREELNGTSILDVTDPRAPRYLAHIPGAPGEAEAGGASMVRVCATGDGRPTCSARSATSPTRSGTSASRAAPRS